MQTPPQIFSVSACSWVGRFCRCKCVYFFQKASDPFHWPHPPSILHQTPSPPLSLHVLVHASRYFVADQRRLITSCMACTTPKQRARTHIPRLLKHSHPYSRKFHSQCLSLFLKCECMLNYLNRRSAFELRVSEASPGCISFAVPDVCDINCNVK